MTLRTMARASHVVVPVVPCSRAMSECEMLALLAEAAEAGIEDMDDLDVLRAAEATAHDLADRLHGVLMDAGAYQRPRRRAVRKAS